jgi:putative transposase
MKKQHIQLSESDKKYLEELIQKGELPAKVYRRAISLLELNKGKTYTAVSEIVGSTITTLSNLVTRHAAIGLQALYDKPRSGRPVEFDGDQRAKITALACSDPPEGYGEWSLRLLADKLVELEYCDTISHTQVSNILKKTNSNLI